MSVLTESRNPPHESIPPPLLPSPRQGFLASNKPLQAFALFGRATERIREATQVQAELPGQKDATAAEDLTVLTERVTAYR